MKYYKCDMCGTVRRATITFNPLKEGNWTQVAFNLEGREVIWEWNKESNGFYTRDTIATIHHYCPYCYIEYCKKYYPFMPKGE